MGMPMQGGAMPRGHRELTLNEYRAIVESSPVMIWRSSTDARCDYFNETWLAFTGRTMAQELGDGWAEDVHPDDLPRCLETYLGHFARREPFEMEYRLRRHDGVYRYIFDRGAPFADESGQFGGYVGSCVDVHDRKLAETALREQLALKDQFAKVAASVPGVICSFRRRPDGSVSMPFATALAEDLYGLSRDALAADFTPVRAKTDADDRRRMDDMIAESAARMSPFHAECRYVHPRKGLRWLEVWSVPKPEADGSILWHGFVMDVTDRKRAAQALRASEAKHRTFFENIQEYVVIYRAVRDPRGAVVDWTFHDMNARTREHLESTYRALGVLGGGETILGKRVTELARDDRAAWSREHFVIALAGQPVSWERSFAGREYAVTAFKMDDDTIANVVSDVTERKRIEQELRDSDRRKSEFLAMLSHELRNPLAPIVASLFLLDRAPPGSDPAARAREVMRRQIQHLTRLVDDLLDVTRVSRGKIELHRDRIDLREVVRRTCDDHRATFEDAELRLSLSLPAQPVWVDVDVTRVSQIVGNVLVNAAKFTPAGGAVCVTVDAPENGRAVLRVRDTGLGMDQGLLARLFQPFMQGDRGLARTKGGLGLGLALAKGLAELHGGSISARSEGPGRGSELVVSLPLASAAPPCDDQARSAPRGEGRLVLIIEDSVDASQTLADVLALSGHRPCVAPDGRTGIALARELKPDFVLCDIGLPDVDGYDVARTLRADASLRKAHLIAISGYAQPDDQRRAKEAGFEAHLPKPAPPDALNALLATLR